MTGQNFIDALTRQITLRGKLDVDYTPSDLTIDAASTGLWYRKPSTYDEQAKMQAEDILAPKTGLHEYVGGAE